LGKNPKGLQDMVFSLASFKKEAENGGKQEGKARAIPAVLL